ncbi:MAG: CoA-binding protein [Anaerolineaceae bacterium]|nr:CoA-binding protein [Anaerolineaceae bacterium]
MATNLKAKVDDFLSQKRIAVAGVSHKNPGNTANAIYKRFRDAGYETIPVNPNAETAEGVTCYKHVQDIPGHVDGVVIVTRAEYTDDVVQDCVKAGVSRVWMHGGIHGPGSSVSETAVSYCLEHNISLIAGACPLMFGTTSDGFHRLIRGVFGVMGRLPN